MEVGEGPAPRAAYTGCRRGGNSVVGGGRDPEGALVGIRLEERRRSDEGDEELVGRHAAYLGDGDAGSGIWGLREHG